MDQRKDRAEGAPPFETCLHAKPHRPTKAQRNKDQKTDSSKTEPSSGVTFKFDPSKGGLVKLKSEQKFDDGRVQITNEDPPGPASSSVSPRSDSSLILRPIDLKNQHQIHHQKVKHINKDPPGSASSSVSPRSDSSLILRPIDLKNQHQIHHQKVKHIHEEPPGLASTYMSPRSDSSLILRPIDLKNQHQIHHQKIPQQIGQQPQTHLDSIFKLLEESMITFVKTELKKIHRALNSDYPEYIESQREDEDEDEEQRGSVEAFLKITRHFLRRMKQEELADCLQSRTADPECRHKLKSNLKEKFQCVFEGIAKAGNPTLLNQIFTELYITEGGTGEVNTEHEVRQIEEASRTQHRAETTIKQEDIFKAPPGRPEPIRTVLTKGVAGIGKTVLTQKFTLDWAEDKTNQNIQFIFPFTFRELNVVKEKNFSLVELVHHFFTETKEAGLCRFEEFQVVFIFDGLDECRLPLDFQKNQTLTDVTKSTSVDVLLTNLIKGNLLPSARLWITTRPAAANQIPPECVDMVTEVRGFTDPQKEEYFSKRFEAEEQVCRIISHIKTSRSLHIMCHIPVFCWITATVLEEELQNKEAEELPRTLTEMYIHFLVVQSKLKTIKYEGGVDTDPLWGPESRKMIIPSLTLKAFCVIWTQNAVDPFQLTLYKADDFLLEHLKQNKFEKL